MAESNPIKKPQYSASDINEIADLLNQEGPLSYRQFNKKLEGNVLNLAKDIYRFGNNNNSLEWADLYALFPKVERFEDSQASRARLRQALGYSPTGVKPEEVSSRVEWLEVPGQKPGKPTDHLALTLLEPSQKPDPDQPTLIYIAGLNTPGPAYETLLTHVAKERGQRVIIVDLPGNGGSTHAKGGVSSNDLTNDVQFLIQNKIPEGGKFELAGFSLGTLPARKIQAKYSAQGNQIEGRQLVQTLLIAPYPAHQESLAGAGETNKAFLGKEFFTVAFGGHFVTNKIHPFVSEARSQADKAYLNEVMSRNELPAQIWDAYSYESKDKNPWDQALAKGEVKVVFHEDDQLFRHNLSETPPQKGIYILPGGHMACAGREISQEYIDGFIAALDEGQESSKATEANLPAYDFSKAYRNPRYDRFLSFIGGTEGLGARFTGQVTQGIRDFGDTGFAWVAGASTRLYYAGHQSWGLEPLSPYLGVSLEAKGAPLRADVIARARAGIKGIKANDNQKLYWINEGALRVTYQPLGLLYLGVEGSLGVQNRFIKSNNGFKFIGSPVWGAQVFVGVSLQSFNRS